MKPQHKKFLLLSLVAVAIAAYYFKDKLTEMLGIKLPGGEVSTPEASIGASAPMTITQGEQTGSLNASFDSSAPKQTVSQAPSGSATTTVTATATDVATVAASQAIPVNDQVLVDYFKLIAQQPKYNTPTTLSMKIQGTRNWALAENQTSHPTWRYAVVDKANRPGFSNVQIDADIQKYQKYIFNYN